MPVTKNEPQPAVYLFVTIAIMILLNIISPSIIPYPFTLIGAIPLIIGIAASLMTKELFRSRTTIMPYGQPEVLLTHGLFRRSRNPIYLGAILALAGIALLLGSLLAFIPVIAFWAVLNYRFIPHEEHVLKKTFKEYAKYCKNVKRWL